MGETLTIAIMHLEGNGELTDLVGNRLLVTGFYPEGLATAAYLVDNGKVMFDKEKDFQVHSPHSPNKQVDPQLLMECHDKAVEEYRLRQGM